MHGKLQWKTLVLWKIIDTLTKPNGDTYQYNRTTYVALLLDLCLTQIANTVYGKNLKGKTFVFRVDNGNSLEKFCISMLVDFYWQLTKP